MLVNHTDFAYTAFNVAQVIFTAASFLNFMVISVDRFLAVHLSSSQISGTCDSQASFCRGNLILDFESTLWIIKFVLEFKTICLPVYVGYFGVLFHSFSLMFLNSPLNPVIYWWKIRHIRQAHKDVLPLSIFPRQTETALL